VEWSLIMSLFVVNVTGEAVNANTVETLLQVVASSSKSLEVVRWGVSFNGTSASDVPVRVELLRLSSQGTSSAFTPLKLDPASDAPLATARTAHTAEPTVGDVLEPHQVTPYGGLLVMQYAPDERIRVPASGRIGIRCLAPAAVNATAFLVFNE
jgi:hypothetical protein